HLHEKHPGTRFSLIVGADVLSEAGKWYRWERVAELARLIPVGRHGHPLPPEVKIVLPAISSTEIRGLRERGEDVSALVPARVLRYIEERGLYPRRSGSREGR
ncbi:MAG TPA: nicotinate-nicotinamide nucleotide adenylyltransferase, partial [Anaeromyxobacteraceae bacterium]|nr:nicotinate-nicotinamide nucleotide adenylyltransferase [Anaeromyxobacteraceae bacterium]